MTAIALAVKKSSEPYSDSTRIKKMTSEPKKLLKVTSLKRESPIPSLTGSVLIKR